eukprot:TRINITY_DN34111_c0_g1_i1.p1 TRINITY_DN34111_c0_g1~~TRINITY_DN34111_c0_g1_i1.p1  ORF type:complete len:273 (-),score=64.90 TRINITY_DN34111_c0_g1_i1:75-893(-)
MACGQELDRRITSCRHRRYHGAWFALPLLLLGSGVLRAFLTPSQFAGSFAGTAARVNVRPSIRLAAAANPAVEAALAEALQNYQMGMQQLETGSNVAQGLQMVTKAAEMGLGPALMDLGVFYAEGMYGCPMDAALAKDYLERAANAGIPDLAAQARYNLGVLYLDGRNGFPQDKREAARCFKAAGEADHPQAMLNMATMFFKGDGIPKDASEGSRWLIRVARNYGNVEGLMEKISAGTVDPETQGKLAEMIERLRANKDLPDLSAGFAPPTR